MPKFFQKFFMLDFSSIFLCFDCARDINIKKNAKKCYVKNEKNLILGKD